MVIVRNTIYEWRGEGYGIRWLLSSMCVELWEETVVVWQRYILSLEGMRRQRRVLTAAGFGTTAPPLPPGVGGYEEEGAQSMETSCPGNTVPPCIQFVVVCEYTVADCHSPRIDKMLI